MNESPHWRDAYAKATADTPHECLPPEELLAALGGGLDAPRHERAVQAMADCARCAAVAQIAQDLQANLAADESAFAKLGERTGVPPRAPRPRLARWAAAAAAVVVLGVGTLLVLPHQPVPGVVRGAAENAVEPASGSALRAAPARLGWNAIGAAPAYRVELYDERAESLWRSERIAATQVDLPPELRARLARGTYLWRVRAEGSEIEIGPFYFRVEP
jgi:hypothetical protein